MKRSLFQSPGYTEILSALLFILLPLGFGGKEGMWAAMASFAFLIVLFLLRNEISINFFGLPFTIFILFSALWSESPHITIKWFFYFLMTLFISSLSKNQFPKVIKPAIFIVSISIVIHYIKGGSPYLTTSGRAGGTFFHPNAGAGFLLPAGVFSVYPRFDIPLFIVSLTGILLTGSRIVFSLFLFSSIVTLFFRFRKRMKIWYVFLFLIFTGLLFVALRSSPVWKRFSIQTFYSSFNVRMSLWKDTISAISENPMIGYGYGSFESIFPYFQKSGVYSRFPHSFILEILFSSGLLGFFLFAFYFYKSFEPSEKWRFSFIPLFLHSLFDFSLSAPANMGIFLTMISGKGFKKIRFEKPILYFLFLFLFLFGLSDFFFSLSKTRKSLEASIRWGEMAYAVFPISADRATMLSNLYLERFRKTGDRETIEKARRFAERAINIEGRNYSHYLNMGTIHLYLNDRKSALSSFKKSMSLYPQYPKLYLYAGELAFRDGMDSEALRIVEKGIFLEKILLSAENNEIIDIIELYRLKILVLKKYGMLNEVDKTKKDALSLGEIIRSKGLIERRTSRGRSVREALEEIRNM